MSRVLPLALAVTAALGGIVHLELQGASGPDAGAVPSRPAVPAAADAPAPGLQDAAQDWVTTALGRPLFSADRRPAQEAAAVTAAKAAPDFRLTGVMTGPFGRRAIFMVAGNAKPVVVEAGGRVGGAVVREIRQGQAVVESDGAVRTLTPSFTAAAPRPGS